MRKRLAVLVIFGLLLIACNQTTTQSANQVNEEKQASGGKVEDNTETSGENTSVKTEEAQNSKPTINSQTKEPKTVMDFFALLPEKYFTLEGCFREDDKDCRKARAEYIKNYKEVEDIKNGYFKGGCDGGQSCIEMALFKRPDRTYVIALALTFEDGEENHFLDYKNGIWTDISKEVVPEFNKKNIYEIPRYGTTVKVYSTKLIEKGEDFELREKGDKIYELEWKDGKFVKK